MSAIFSVRASSLSELFDCPARWASKHIEGKRTPSGAAAVLGKAVHVGTAVFDTSRLPGGSPVTADDAAGALVDSIHMPSEDVDWDEDSPKDVETVALALHKRYCADIAPKQDYCAVELQCESLEITDIGITLTGTTDRVRRTAEGYGIADLKTGKSVVGTDGSVATKGYTYQLGVYELLAEHAGGMPITAPAQIIGMNTAKTAASQRAGLGEVSGARAVLIGSPEHPGVLETASRILRTGLFWGNPRSMMCHQKYCPEWGTCKWRL